MTSSVASENAVASIAAVRSVEEGGCCDFLWSLFLDDSTAAKTINNLAEEDDRSYASSATGFTDATDESLSFKTESDRERYLAWKRLRTMRLEETLTEDDNTQVTVLQDAPIAQNDTPDDTANVEVHADESGDNVESNLEKASGYTMLMTDDKSVGTANVGPQYCAVPVVTPVHSRQEVKAVAPQEASLAKKHNSQVATQEPSKSKSKKHDPSRRKRHSSSGKGRHHSEQKERHRGEEIEQPHATDDRRRSSKGKKRHPDQEEEQLNVKDERRRSNKHKDRYSNRAPPSSGEHPEENEQDARKHNSSRWSSRFSSRKRSPKKERRDRKERHRPSRTQKSPSASTYITASMKALPPLAPHKDVGHGPIATRRHPPAAQTLSTGRGCSFDGVTGAPISGAAAAKMAFGFGKKQTPTMPSKPATETVVEKAAPPSPPSEKAVVEVAVKEIMPIPDPPEEKDESIMQMLISGVESVIPASFSLVSKADSTAASKSLASKQSVIPTNFSLVSKADSKATNKSIASKKSVFNHAAQHAENMTTPSDVNLGQPGFDTKDAPDEHSSNSSSHYEVASITDAAHYVDAPINGGLYDEESVGNNAFYDEKSTNSNHFYGGASAAENLYHEDSNNNDLYDDQNMKVTLDDLSVADVSARGSLTGTVGSALQQSTSRASDLDAQSVRSLQLRYAKSDNYGMVAQDERTTGSLTESYKSMPTAGRPPRSGRPPLRSRPATPEARDDGSVQSRTSSVADGGLSCTSSTKYDDGPAEFGTVESIVGSASSVSNRESGSTPGSVAGSTARSLRSALSAGSRHEQVSQSSEVATKSSQKQRKRGFFKRSNSSEVESSSTGIMGKLGLRMNRSNVE